jgi:hypothetical protein
VSHPVRETSQPGDQRPGGNPPRRQRADDHQRQRLGLVSKLALAGRDAGQQECAGALAAEWNDHVKVDYVRAWLPKDETGEQKNGAVAFSYSVSAR